MDDIPIKELLQLHCHQRETIINGWNYCLRTTSNIQETSRTTNPDASVISQLKHVVMFGAQGKWRANVAEHRQATTEHQR